MGISGTAALAIAAAAAGYYASSQTNKPKTPPLEQAPSAPQSSKAPDAGSVRAAQSGAGQAGGSPGVAQTFLTGPGGIDPALLNLGRSTLLGGGNASSAGGVGG